MDEPLAAPRAPHTSLPKSRSALQLSSASPAATGLGFGDPEELVDQALALSGLLGRLRGFLGRRGWRLDLRGAG